MDTIRLNKFDAAERQFLQAIRLFFEGGDEVSIHTLVEAANQVFSDLGKKQGIKGIIRESEWVKPDKQKEWRNYVFKCRNFFKHADKDVDDTIDFKVLFNHLSIIEGLHMYNQFKGTWVPETICYYFWCADHYPELLLKENQFNAEIFSAFESGRVSSPVELSTMSELIKCMRNGSYIVNNISLNMGL
ncbi:TPA: hypothetical protein RUZ68_003676 [Vibrio cholerae]|uniref:hypothetical protein n=1 Tax=Vibrio cholerae TaxID=666 RepID=UPI00115797F2|nr:hypothetical protein [Vibrio cholerae]EJL6681226.1 hypothetical protein [Vibrio cholerae]EKF9810561.1 hypothetical protein [Vibrio cholerae]TQP94015.1 hypothetical protein FLL73_16065 [Vibrio cholerae]HAS3568632.1 hypothetical protein [Vibrio cholerae]HDZ9164550.1 hypothetical protein [Vibrio cholerae]